MQKKNQRLGLYGAACFAAAALTSSCCMHNCTVESTHPSAESAPADDRSAQPKKENTMKKTTVSGLEYKILASASGTPRAPKKGERIAVHYTGGLAEDADGEIVDIFDSSRKRGKPFEFVLGLGQVIKGWDEGLSLMRVGDSWRLYIPADLGYGARGVPGVIPSNATLIFDVELVAVK